MTFSQTTNLLRAVEVHCHVFDCNPRLLPALHHTSTCVTVVPTLKTTKTTANTYNLAKAITAATPATTLTTTAAATTIPYMSMMPALSGFSSVLVTGMSFYRKKN